MDIENFEFRPLTKGLGFDKTTEESRQSVQAPKVAPQAKTVDMSALENVSFEMDKTEVANDAPVSRSLKKMLDSLPPSMDYKEDVSREKSFVAPEVPKPSEMKKPIEVPTTAFPKFERPDLDVKENFDVTLDNSLSQAFPKAELNKSFYHQMVTPQPQFKEVSSSFASAVLDTIIVLALSSLFVVSLIAITQIDIFNMILNHNMGAKVAMEVSLLFLGTTLFYYMLSRGLFGSTLGDWAFDVQLGADEERHKITYPFQVLFRVFMIIATGVITIPVLSMAFGKDLGYYFSGLKLYCRQY